MEYDKETLRDRETPGQTKSSLLGLVDHFQGGGVRLDARLLLVELA